MAGRSDIADGVDADDNEFVTRPDVNPLFRIRRLEEVADQIADIVRSGSDLKKDAAERAGGKLRVLSSAFDHLLEYLRQLAAANERIQNVLHRASVNLNPDQVNEDDRSDRDQLQDEVLSDDERARLQQHIPGFNGGANRSGDPEIRSQVLSLKSQLDFLQKKLDAPTDQNKLVSDKEEFQPSEDDPDQRDETSESAIEAVARINQRQIENAPTTILGQLESLRSKQEADPERLREERERRRLAYDEERRQYEMRRDPDNWPVLKYAISSDASLVSSDVGCAVRVPEGTNIKRLECRPQDVIVEAGPREALASSVITLATKDQEPIRFEFPALISLPYKPKAGFEPFVYVKEGPGNWMAVSTSHYMNEHVNMAQFERNTLQHLTFAIKMCQVHRHDVTAHRSTIEDPEHQTFRIVVPEGSFQDVGEIRLKFVDEEQMSETGSRLSDPEVVDMLSVLCHLHISGTRKGLVQAEIGFSGESALPAILPPGHRVHLMTSSDGFKWTRNEAVRTADNRRYAREIRSDENDLWLLLIRTKGFFNPNDTPKLAREIMSELCDLPLFVLLYQHEHFPERVHLETCTRATLTSVLDRLKEQGYTKGTTRLVYVSDGSYLHIRPSAEGNIEFTDDVKQPIVIKHMSCLDTGDLSSPIQIKVRNKYIQKNHPAYGGKIQVYNVKVAFRTDGSNKEKIKVFLCELPVVLPKESVKSEPKPRIPQKRTFLGSEPLTADYLRELLAELGDKWIDVALRLGLNNATIQKVMSKWPDPEEAKFELFSIWYMRSNINASKISRLMRVLSDVRRPDLADDLRRKYDVTVEEKRLKNKEMLLSLLARRVATDPGALDDWKNVLRALNVDDTTISAIEEEKRPVNRIYCLERGLLHWLRLDSNRSNPKYIYQTLKQLGHVAAADQVSLWLGMKNVR